MKSRISRALLVLSVLFAFTATATVQVTASSAASSAATASAKKKKKKKKRKLKVSIVSTGQKDLISKKVFIAKVTAARKGKIRVQAFSSTFDGKDVYKPLSVAKKFRFKRGGQTKKVKLRLKSVGRAAVKTCEDRRLQVRAGSKRSSFRYMKRQSGECKPQSIDLSQAYRCDFIGAVDDSLCMLPFPNDFYTLGDASTPTGKRINFQTGAMPVNDEGININADAYSASDGFSQGQSIVVKVPGLDNAEALAMTDAASLADPSTYADKDAPVVVLNAATGERHPVWTEIDSTASTPASTAVIIHPLVNFDAEGRYIVAMRNLKDSTGNVLSAPPGFRYYRDSLPSNKSDINQRRSHFEGVFRKLRGAGIARSNLYLAWDFTVASDESNSERALAMRDKAFAELGDTDMSDLKVPAASSAPAFTVDSVTDNPNAEIARKVLGHFQVTCFMTNGCEPDGRLKLGADGLPEKTGMYSANFYCIVPNAAESTPARAMVYGHGLMGGAGETGADPQRQLADQYGFVVCGTDEIGMSSNDLLTVVTALRDLSGFPSVADRLQQGLLNEMFLSRLMIHPDGLISDPAFRSGGISMAAAPVIDTTTQRSYYRGNSQGGIMGGAYMALSPDADRGALGVSGMNYSVLLQRSVDWHTYSAFMYPAYPNEITRPLALSIVQMLWDRGEPNGYAHRMTDNPLPNTPPHKVLIDVALGDHQVTNFQANVEARTIGAKAVAPVVYDGRWPGVDYQWNIPSITSYPYDGSAIGYWDGGPLRDDPMNPGEMIGTNTPPITNLPNDAGKDPHEYPRRAPSDLLMVSGFLKVGGKINNTCGAGPCYSNGYTGP